MFTMRRSGKLRVVFVTVCLLALVFLLPERQAAAAKTAHSAHSLSSASESAMYACRPETHVTAPPSLLKQGSSAGVADKLNKLPAVCGAGQVPQPASRFLAKKLLQPSQLGDKKARVSDANLNYLYGDAYQYAKAAGTGANLSEHNPYLDPSDYHSLAEVAGESADGRQIVEIGWTVDRTTNKGDERPHLFVYHWVNGNGSCYNGCGYVQYSHTRYPGMRVAVTTPQQYAMQYFQGAWWLWYQSEWIGYFPGALWSGHYSQLGLTQWFGEVAASTTAPCTFMGDGFYGTYDGSAQINNIHFIGGPDASVSYSVTNPAYYNEGHKSKNGFTYGGPGAC